MNKNFKIVYVINRNVLNTISLPFKSHTSEIRKNVKPPTLVLIVVIRLHYLSIKK